MAPLLLLALSACGTGSGIIPLSPPEDTSGETTLVEDSAGTTPFDTGWCLDQPVITYANFGQGFMTGACQGCHASTATNRYGAPESVIFDTVADCWEHADRILARSTGDNPGMPPQGGVEPDDRERLDIWLSCATPGT